MRQNKIINTNLGSLPLVAIYDSALDVGRLFVRELAGKPVTFDAEENRIIDRLTNSEWTSAGDARSGKLSGQRLKQHPSYDVMWFAWYAFFPATEVVA